MLLLPPSLGDQRIGDQASDIGFIFRSLVRSRIEWIMAVVVGAANSLRARVQRVFAVFKKVSVSGSLHVNQHDIGATHERGIFTQDLGIFTQEYGNV